MPVIRATVFSKVLTRRLLTMNITLKDGNVIEAEVGVTAQEIARRISEGLARAALIAKVDGELVDLTYKLEHDCTL